MYISRYLKTAMKILILLLFLTSPIQKADSNELHQAERPSASTDKLQQARQLFKSRNYNDSFKVTTKLLETGYDSTAFKLGVKALKILGRDSEIDGFITDILTRYPSEWRGYYTAALLYSQELTHYGYFLGESFKRGHTGNYRQLINISAHDRLQALAYMQKAKELALKTDTCEYNKSEVLYQLATLYISDITPQTAIRLLLKSDYTNIPAYSQTPLDNNLNGKGAPVTRNGTPVFFKLPDNEKAAENDGQLFRYYLHQSSSFLTDDCREKQKLADFSQLLYGVQTLAQIDYNDNIQDDYLAKLHELDDNTSIARLENGIHEFQLPASYNYLALFKQISCIQPSASIFQSIAEEYENRRQYSKALKYWLKISRLSNIPGQQQENAERHIRQLRQGFISFQSCGQQTTAAPNIWLRFRNTSEVTLSARKISIEKLLRNITRNLKQDTTKQRAAASILNNLEAKLVAGELQEYLSSPVYQDRLYLASAQPQIAHAEGRIQIHLPGTFKSGAYFIQASLDSGYTTNIILWLNDTIITAKPLTSGKRLYFVSDGTSGKSIANTELNIFGYSTRNWQLQTDNTPAPYIQTTIRTNNNGLAILPQQYIKREFNYLITATTPAGNSVFDGFQQLYQYLSQRQEPTTKIIYYTSKPLYHSGETINIAGWIRNYDYTSDLKQQNDLQDITLNIFSPDGKKAASEKVEIAENGNFSFTFKPEAVAPLGVWRIDSSLKLNSAGNYFRIEEYVKPEFTAAIEAVSKQPVFSKPLEFQVRAAYNFGGPLQNARIDYELYRQPEISTYLPAKRWDWLYGKGFGYREDNGNATSTAAYKIIPAPSKPELIAQSTLYTNNNGEAIITEDPLAMSKGIPSQSCRYTLKATITDNSNRSITRESNLIVNKAEFNLSIQTDQNFYNKNENITVSTTPISNDREITPVAPRELSLQLYRYNRKLQKTLVKSYPKATINANGKFIHKLSIAQPGYYTLECQTTDSLGTAVNTSKNIYVYSPDNAEYLPAAQPVTIIPKKNIYRLNEKAELLIVSSEPATTLLLFPGITSQRYPYPQVLQTQKNAQTIDYTIKPEDTPNTFIEILSTQKNRITSANAELFIPPVKKILNLAVTPDKSDYAPGAAAKIKLTLTDNMNKPVESQAIVTVYDAALEELSGAATYPDIKDFFWGFSHSHYPDNSSSADKFSYNIYNKNTLPMQPIGIFGNFFNLPGTILPLYRKTGIRMSNLSTSLEAPMAVTAEMSADSLQAAPAAVTENSTAEHTPRNNFKTGAVFLSNVSFNKSGEAIITVPLPETLTTWKIRVWCLNSSTQVAEAAATMLTSKELMLIPSLPRYLIKEDKVKVKTAVYNNSETVMPVTLTLTPAAGLKALADTTKTIKLEPHSERNIAWQLQAETIASGDIIFTASAKSAADSIRLPLAVLENKLQIFDSRTALISAKSYKSDFSLPRSRENKSAKLEITLFPAMSSLLTRAITDAASRNYITNDAILTQYLPAAILYSTSPIKYEKEISNLKPEITRAVAALTENQNQDGGWSWIAANGLSSEYITALVLNSLERADSLGYKIPAELITGARLYLINYQQEQLKLLINYNSGDKDSKSKAHPSNLDALIYAVLSQSNNENRRMRNFLFKDRSFLSVFGLSLLGSGLSHSDDTTLLPQILTNIQQYLIEDTENSTAYLDLNTTANNWQWYNSESATIANYLSLHLSTGTDTGINDKLAHYLVNNIRNTSRRDSIHAITAIITALTDYAATTENSQPPATLLLAVNNSPQETISLPADNTPLTISYPYTKLKTGKNILQITAPQQQPFSCYLSTTLSYTANEKVTAPHGLELKVQRNYYKLTPEKKVITLPDGLGGEKQQLSYSYVKTRLNIGDSIKAGDLIESELIVTSKNDYEYIILKDQKPACLEPLETRSGFKYNTTGYYAEYRDRTVDYYVESMPRGTHTFNYRGSVIFDGIFTAPAATSTGAFTTILNSNSAGYIFNVNK